MPRDALIQIRRGTTAQWAAADAASVGDPTRLLADGERGLNTTTGEEKIGTATPTLWSALPVALSGTYVKPVAVAVVVGDGVTVETSAVQSALNKARDAGGGWVLVPFVGVGVVLIDDTLVVYPNTTLNLDPGVVIRKKTGVFGNMINNAALGTTGTGGISVSVAAGSTAVTSAHFVAGNVGQPFTLWGAGVNFGPVTGTVTGVGAGTLSAAATNAVGPRADAGCTTSSSSSTVTDTHILAVDEGLYVTGAGMPANAQAVNIVEGVSFQVMVAGALTNATATGTAALTIGVIGYVAVGTPDANITIQGGTWDFQDGSGVYGGAYIMRFRRATKITVRNTKVLSTGGDTAKYAIDMGDVADYTVENIELLTGRDGVHIEGPAVRGRISNIRGRSGDDFIALSVGNYPGYIDVLGPITDCDVSGITLDQAAGGCSMQGCSARFYLDRISYRNISGTVAAGRPVRIANDGIMRATYVQGASIANVSATNGNAGNPEVGLQASYIHDVTVDGVTHLDTIQSILVGAGCFIETLTVTRFRSMGGSGNNVVQVDGRVTDFTMDGVNAILGANGRLVQVSNGGRVDRFTLTNYRVIGPATGTKALTVFLQAAGAAACRAAFGNGFSKNCNYFVDHSGTMTVLANNIEIDTVVIAFYLAAAAANLRIIAGNVSQVAANFSVFLTAGSVASVHGSSFAADVAVLTPVHGDLAWNTNGALACGTGPVVYSSTAGKWKSLYTGVTN